MIKKILIGLLVAVVFFILPGTTESKRLNDHPYTAEAFKTSGGWGYKISEHGQVIIFQEYIPALEGKQSFQHQETAVLAGNLVIRKIISNRSPVITKKELIKLLKQDANYGRNRKNELTKN